MMVKLFEPSAPRRAGVVRSIGTAGFDELHLAWITGLSPLTPRTEDITAKEASLHDDPPANMSHICVNQVEFHVGYHDDDLLHYCRRANITLQAAGAPHVFPGPSPSDPTLQRVAKAHGVSAGEVLLRWVVQQGVPVVVGRGGMAAAAAALAPLFAFTLVDEEMAALSDIQKAQATRKHGLWYV